MIGKICGIGAYAPSSYLDNHDLSKMVSTNDTWIQERTGVVKRHIIEQDTTVTMAYKAADRALEDADIQAEELDMIIVSTISSNVIMPCTACEVQQYIGAINATCFDLNAACTGFLYAFNTAQGYIASGMCKKVMIIGAESLSTLVDWSNRGTCILFGDGAGAIILDGVKGALPKVVMGSDGRKGNALTCESRHQKDWKVCAVDDRTYIRMDGQEVFKFAVKQVPISIQELLDKNQIKKENIDYFILHQANKRIVEAVAKRLKVEISKFPMNLQEFGNTSSASIPLLLDEMKRNGQLQQGQNIVLSGFGAGFSWGASLVSIA
ncbi:beta-ketoacyl-ACP synthase III [Lachnospiraceae bacterium LCP25S3_G4]